MKKVLVTGADGFIGSHLVEYLHSQGYNVRALAQYNSFNSWGWLENASCLNDIEVISGDIRDGQFCRSLCEGVDTVFHLAALIAIPYSYQAPQSYVDTNVNGTLNMCQAALANNVSTFIQTSTSEVYGTARYVPIDEKHPLQPQSPYSASKIASDAMAMSFFNAFDLPVTIARPFNTYGPRQSARAVIPTIITQLLDNTPTIKLGDVSPTRDFNYVSDTCAGLIALANCNEAAGKTVNIGSNYEVSIAETVQLIQEIIGADTQIEMDSVRLRPEKSEVNRLWCDNTLIQQLTGFKPAHSLQQGLEKTIEWFREDKNRAVYKSHLYNV